MCGIVGYINVRKSDAADQAILAAMCQTIIYRGPDDQGIYAHGQAGLGMRRLSIIDLHTGHQPISNETESLWVVLNGEIYNYQPLAEWLLQRGHRLKTSSDTEVIVHLFEELGEGCLDRLRGMFAFAIWDQHRSRLFVARDRLGVKPLYYYWDESRLVFGSELKTLLAHPDVETSLDVRAVETYLRYSYIPDPQTIFERIKKLPPGHYLTLEDGRLNVVPYWNGLLPNPTPDAELSEGDALTQLDGLLQDAVRLRMVSDVPVGAFLSGGVDSSLIVALMSRQMSRPVTTFSIGFAEAEYNELPYARQVATHLGTDHHELIVEPQNCDVIEQLVAHFDEPFGDPSAIPMYFLCGLAAKHVKVALSGDGGDELFAGYERYSIELQRQSFDRLPSSLKRACGWASDQLWDGAVGKRYLHNMSLAGPGRYMDSVTYTHQELLHHLLDPQLVHQLASLPEDDQLSRHFTAVAGQPWLAQLQYVDGRCYLPADVMTKVDRMSMAHSIEAREPLLDHVLAEFAARLPMSLRIRDGVTKYLLKRVAERYLPHSIIYRKKQGFGVPLEYWFKGDLRAYVRDVLFSHEAKTRGMLNPTAVEGLLRQYESGRSEYAQTIWLLLMLETWCRLYQRRSKVQCVR
jgi:asparagine synthase (glutamine-hydrolysing)